MRLIEVQSKNTRHERTIKLERIKGNVDFMAVTEHLLQLHQHIADKIDLVEFFARANHNHPG